jgi:hypothetical protein
MLFTLHVFASSTLGYGDVVFGVWSGREYTTRRVVSQAGTWYQLVPEIHIYSDEFANDSISLVLNESNRTNIVFHPFGHKGGHLMGSEWEHRWYYAQTRHLLTMADLYERFPNKTWYIWADDDTYLYPDSVLAYLDRQDATVLRVFGVVYCSWDTVAEIIEPIRRCHPFCQGGAGAFFSHKMMSSIAPFLRNCSEMFNDPNFAGSMRLAICIERFIGTDNWNIGDAAMPVQGRLHSSNPLTETELGGGIRFPLSFHRMRHVLLYQIWNATESIWTDRTGRERHINWDNITMTTSLITVGDDKKPMILHWGFRLRWEFSDLQYFYAISRPEPKFEPRDTGKVSPIMFDQAFEGNIILRYICDESLESSEMVMDSYLWPEADGTAFRVKCPPSSYFPNPNRTDNTPRIIPMRPGMLTI